MKNEALFRTGSVWKSIISMAVPSIIIILVMVLYNMADMFLWAVWAILHRWRRSPLWDRCFRSLRRWQRCLAQAAVLSLHAALARVRSSRARSAPRSASGPAFSGRSGQHRSAGGQSAASGNAGLECRDLPLRGAVSSGPGTGCAVFILSNSMAMLVRAEGAAKRA